MLTNVVGCPECRRDESTLRSKRRGHPLLVDLDYNLMGLVDNVRYVAIKLNIKCVSAGL